MNIEGYEMPDELYYHDEHSWVKVEGDVGIVGLNDFAQKMAGTIKRVVTLEEDDEVQLGKPCGTVSSGKWTGKLYSPVSGEITEVNEDIEDEPSLHQVHADEPRRGIGIGILQHVDFQAM